MKGNLWAALAAVLLAACALPLPAVAQNFDRPVQIIAPFSAGGDAHLASRNLAAVLPKYINQNVIVVNRAGASGAIGSEYVKRDTPDGYTLTGPPCSSRGPAAPSVTTSWASRPGRVPRTSAPTARS